MDIKKRLLLLVLLLILPVVSAGEVFDGWVTSKSTFTADGILYQITLGSNHDKAIIASNVTSLIVGVGDCAEKIGYNFCFKAERFNLSLGYGRIDFESE